MQLVGCWINTIDTRLANRILNSSLLASWLNITNYFPDEVPTDPANYIFDQEAMSISNIISDNMKTEDRY